MLLLPVALTKRAVRRNPSNSLLSRALIRLRKAGLTQHVENCGTNSSNPPLSSGESDELRIRPPPNINKASSNRSRRRGYGAAGSGPRS